MRRLIFVIFILLPSFLCAKERYYFSNLSLKDGLSQITVTSIYQDKNGFIWFGTRNGLNRYDGYKFDIFTTNPEDETSISDNHILCITEDKAGNLWIGTNNGLNKLDLSTNKFKRYFSDSADKSSLSHNMIPSIHFDSDNNLWIGTNKGVNLYDPDKNSFKRIDIGGLLNDEVINAIVREKDELYIGTSSKGLIAYNVKNKSHKLYQNDFANPNSIALNQIRTVFVDSKHNIWVGTYSKGVSVLKKGEENFISYNRENGLTNDYIRCIAETPEGDILVGTFNGLNLIDPKSGEVIQYKTYDSDHGNLSHYSIYSIFFDKDRTLWVGTYAGGINYYSTYGQKFRFYDPGTEQKTIMGIIGPMLEIDNSIYIATEGGGLLEMDKQTESFKLYKLYNDSEGAYARNILKSLYRDGQRILCGTNIGTIYSFDLASKQFTPFYKFENENSIYHISRDSNGDLIIGGVNQIGFVILTKDGHVKNKFAVKGKTETSFLNVRCVYEVEKNVFLIGTRNDGLYYYNSNTSELLEFRSNHDNKTGDQLPENYITSIFKDSSSQIWIGTFGGGFSYFDLKNKSFKTYTTRDGLLDNNVCTIVEDNNRHLWISTISGITDFNLDSKEFKNYTHSSGIKINEFTPHAGIRLSNDLIMFSGNNGFISFNPRKMSFNPYVPAIILENLYINNERIVPKGKDGILDKQLFQQKEITLKYNESNISIEYSALNYIFSNKNQYSYMLEGFDEDWNDVGSRRIAYYTNLPPGEYKFMVRGSNNDGVWNDEGASIMITILPPFWKTWWAYCLYALSLIGITILIIRYYNERKRLENDIKLKQAEAKVQEEFHQARNKLFTNFSHELRTPLTLILSPLEDMVEQGQTLPPKVQENHRLMHSNGLRMLRIVNNLMDFQKKESGTMKLEVSEGDFVKFTDEMYHNFTELAASRNINYSFHHSADHLDYWFDRNLMEKVYFNFLSNAFKNTPNGGSINVDLKTNTLSELKHDIPNKAEYFNNENIRYIVLEIKDSGAGIAPDELEKIFIPFYQVAQNEHSSSGTGLGLSLSKSIIEMHHGVIWAESLDQSGAAFRCILPVSKEYYNEDEIIETKENEEVQSYEVEIKKEEEQQDVVTEEGKSVKRKKVHTILVVEDNSDVRNYIISHLVDNYNIIKASNGSEAIDKAFNFMPDLIISDLMMPKMDGMEMASKLKSDMRTSHIPIIMITAKAMPSDMKEGYEVGADDYITKPFNSSVLVARVDNIIQSREKLKDIYSKRFSLETLGVETTSADDQFMQKLYKTLEKNVSNPELNVDNFSKEIGMSKANLYRKIKSLTNLSPNEFIRNFRLEMAAKMLKETKQPVSDVYVAVGFSSHAYFSNCFKALYGISPTEYANQLSGKK